MEAPAEPSCSPSSSVGTTTRILAGRIGAAGDRASLRSGDPMEAGVEVPVAAAAESMACPVGSPDWQRQGAPPARRIVQRDSQPLLRGRRRASIHKASRVELCNSAGQKADAPTAILVGFLPRDRGADRTTPYVADRLDRQVTLREAC